MNVKTNLLSWASVVTASLFCCSVLIFNLSMPILPHVLFVMWLFIAIIANGKKIAQIVNRQRYVFFYIFIGYYFFASLMAFGLNTSINRVITMFELVTPFIMYEIYSEYGKKAKLFFILSITAILLFNINEMRQVVFSSFGQGLKQHAEDDSFLNTAFHQIYSLALLSGYFVYILRKIALSDCKYKQFITVCLITSILVIGAIVTLSMYATALFLMFFGIILGIIYKRPNWQKKIILITLFVVVGYITFFPLILSAVQTYIPDSKILVARFQEVMNILDGHADEDASSSARFSLSMISLNTFWDNPIIGITHETGDIDKILFVKLGNHAEWVDDLALYGVFAFALFGFVWKTYIILYKKADILVLFGSFLLLGFFNKCLYVVIMTIVFLYAPLIHDLICSNMDVKKNALH